MKKYSKNIWSFGNLRNALFISQFLIVPCKYIYGQTPSPFLKLLLWILTAVLLFPSHLLFPFFFSPPENWRHRGRYQELQQRRRTRLPQINSTRPTAVELFIRCCFKLPRKYYLENIRKENENWFELLRDLRYRGWNNTNYMTEVFGKSVLVRVGLG